MCAAGEVDAVALFGTTDGARLVRSKFVAEVGRRLRVAACPWVVSTAVLVAAVDAVWTRLGRGGGSGQISSS